MIRRSTKRTAEIRDWNFDFSQEPEILAGATISSATVTTTGTALTIGPAVISGGTVQVQLTAGTTKTRYPMKCAATLSTGKVVVRFGRLYVCDLVA